ncbi:alpha amylase, catalytic domain protein [Mycobacterium xenopi 4042]|uniref:Alpha amylase, catalytic domain protein n=1 Tax=Mycobacterium xenopi 4042 TaxID=1299334 RepID=X8AQT2_MYCXE|nr:alpha amylase, catalytic domain protein [Mycobacterium xenopi 4042]
MFYQVYPRSFADSNGDGVGDLDGVVARLNYLSSLGVDAIWLNPVTVSPMADHGYDVADPRDVDPLFGGLAALERLIGEAHRRGIKITMDLVPNHTSSQHPWFQAALAGGRAALRGIATSFATAVDPADRRRRTTGSRCSVDRPGPGWSSRTAIRASGTCTCSTPSSRT